MLDGTTTYYYDAADRLTKKTKGNGEYETYAYDNADQLTGIGFWWSDGTPRNSLTYGYNSGGTITNGYDLAGNLIVCNQGYYTTTYGYDGADQLHQRDGQRGRASAEPGVHL